FLVYKIDQDGAIVNTDIPKDTNADKNLLRHLTMVIPTDQIFHKMKLLLDDEITEK
ncbi:11557_t:CDS:2, partial [Dentiscutata erythropus]